ncbi:nuclear transport factor 2 family protein [Tomitella gaofuii]|uniref:nuclear transport factor 2 family protein n=1 Tax=Tomitella gaofuii TaxID=2760083 RepID=UPI001F1FDD70|nr:nuclear transport factor 2 family protein [Tomitella gaofuii]
MNARRNGPDAAGPDGSGPAGEPVGGAEIAELAAKQQIRDAVMRYCRGIDRLDMAAVRSAYHPDGVDHHSGFDGPVDGFIAWVEPLLRTLDGTRHEIANHLAEVRGDRAVAESYGVARHWGAHRAMNFTTGLRYVDYFERRGGTWAIVERFAVREWNRSEGAPAGDCDDAGAEAAAPSRIAYGADDGPAGSRDTGDPVYRLLQRLR